MNFVLWWVNRAWSPVVEYWNRPAVEGKQCSGREAIIVGIALICWICGSILGFILAAHFRDGRYFVFSLCLLFSIFPILHAPDAYKYLSKLHTQYRTEQPEREKLKRKNDSLDRCRRCNKRTLLFVCNRFTGEEISTGFCKSCYKFTYEDIPILEDFDWTSNYFEEETHNDQR